MNKSKATNRKSGAAVRSSELVRRVINDRKTKADTERAEQATLRKAAKRVLKDFRGNTQGELQEHISKNHKWLKPLYAKKQYGLSTLAWDLLNAHGFNFVDKWGLPLHA